MNTIKFCGITLALLGMTGCSDASKQGSTPMRGNGAGGSGAAGSSSIGSGGAAASAGSGAGGSSHGAAGGNASAGNGAAGNGAAAGHASPGSGAGGGANASAGSSAAGSAAAGTNATPSVDNVKMWIEDYAKAHPGQAGDILAKTPAELAADPDAQRLRALCGMDQLPVIPQLAWEYGGSDHAWINPAQSALVYCVYIPVAPSSSHWNYDAAAGHVTADVSLLFPDQNPCKDQTGADQIAKCIGDTTNFEILVDTASLNDGADAGLSLSEATTELQLILTDGTKIHLWSD